MSSTKSEIYVALENKFVEGPTLPYEAYSQCMVWVNDTHFAMAGGRVPKKFYLYDSLSETWTEMPDNPQHRGSHPCVVLQTANGVEFVTAGGAMPNTFRSTTIFNFNNNNWRDGPSLPTDMNILNSVFPYGDSAMAVALKVGKQVYKFDIESTNWVYTGKDQWRARFQAAALLIPRELALC